MPFPFTTRSPAAARTLGFWAFAAASAALPVRAHGPPPAIVQVAAADDRGPRVLGLTEGLSILLDGRWVFVCPSLFGSPQPPRAISADGRLTWVAGTAGVFTLDDRARVQRVRLPEPNSGAVTSLVVAGGAVFGLRFSVNGVDVLRMGATAAEGVVSYPERWALLASADSTLFLARVEGRAFFLREISTAGLEIRTWTLDADWQGAIVDLRTSGSAPYAAVFRNERYALFRIADGALAPLSNSDSPIHGPATAAEGSLWIGSGSRLERLPIDEGFLHATEMPVSCLQTHGNRTFACLQHRLHALEETGIGEKLVSLDELVPPAPEDSDLRGTSECWYEWVVFRNDLENIGIGGERDAPNDASDAAIFDASSPMKHGGSSAGCGCRFNSPGSPANALVGAIVLCCIVIFFRSHQSSCESKRAGLRTNRPRPRKACIRTATFSDSR